MPEDPRFPRENCPACGRDLDEPPLVRGALSTPLGLDDFLALCVPRELDEVTAIVKALPKKAPRKVNEVTQGRPRFPDVTAGRGIIPGGLSPFAEESQLAATVPASSFDDKTEDRQIVPADEVTEPVKTKAAPPPTPVGEETPAEIDDRTVVTGRGDRRD